MGGPDAETFRNLINKLIEKGQKKVIVNLRDIDWMNSSGMGILISGLTTLRRNGGDLRLLSVPEKIRALFYVTKLSTIFRYFDNEDDAVASYQSD